MHHVLRTAAMAGLVLGAAQFASAQSSTFDFQDNTDQGFGAGFGNDASKTFTITDIGGSLRLAVPRTGGFQEAGRETGNPADPFFQAMAAAAANEAGYVISYDYYIDTAAMGAGAGNFLQVGTYVNSGSGYYAQNFNTPKELELTGADLASGRVFSGTITQTFAAKGFDIPPTAANPTPETFFRLGFIVNGDGANQLVYFDNITVAPLPEPATLGLLGLAVPAVALRRRRA